MALQSDHEFAPTEIARAAFPTAFRGYDQDAVRRYLSRLAAALEHQQAFDDLGDLEARTPAHDRVEELEAEVSSLQDEIRELETELVQRSVDEADHGSRRASAEAVEFDEHRAIELLGQETARVLESARSAAADILKRAENQAANLKAEAKQELAEARRSAKQLMAERQAEAEAAIDELTEEAERSVERLRVEAEERAARVTAEAEERAERVTVEADEQVARVTSEADQRAERVTAEADEFAERVTREADDHRATVVEESARILAEAERTAEAEQTGAKERARQIVADAEALRHQVVAELVSDRRSAQADVDRLVETRDRLVLSLAIARSEIDGITSELDELSAGGAGSGDGASVEVDGDEVARLIDRLESERSGRNGANGSTGPDGADGEARDRSTVGPSKPSSDLGHALAHDLDDELADDLDEERRRSIVDEPTVEMPAVTPRAESTVGPADLDPAPRDRRERGPEPAVSPSAGVFDTGAPAPEAAEAVAPADAEVDVIDLRDVESTPDSDLDAVADSVDVLNTPPADGAPLSLVEGFSTIVLGDEVAAGHGSGQRSRQPAAGTPEVVPVGVLVDEQPVDPTAAVTTVAGRAGGAPAKGARGDLAIDEPAVDRLPRWFGARDVAITRSGANLRRQLRRALNDDQSEVLDRLRSGRGAIDVDELPSVGEQIEHFLAPLRRGLVDIARAGAQAGGADDVDEAAFDNMIDQLAVYVANRVRLPTVAAIEAADHADRERILEPIRSGYRDFRNIGLPDLVDDALHEAFAIGLWDAIDDDSTVAWTVDPRTDPDPVCEVNRDRLGLLKGEPFPSGHVRPLSIPGCRCLVVPAD